MQTVNNNFTVEALVAKYRNFVKENCPKNTINDGMGAITLTSKDDAEGQLLVTLYKRVAGDNADQKVLKKLSKYAADFYVDALYEDELTFLTNHFSEVSSYVFANPFSGSNVDIYKQYLHTSAQKIEQVRKNVTYKPGMTIFITNAGYCDVAVLFPGCTIKGYTLCDEEYTDVWALGQIRLYAAGIKSKILPIPYMNKQYMSDVDYMVCGTAEFSLPEEVVPFSQYMNANSKLLWIVEKNDAASYPKDTTYINIPQSLLAKNKEKMSNLMNIRKELVDNNNIYSIISFEDADAIFSKKYLCINACKAAHKTILFRDEVSGKKMTITSKKLDVEILWQSYYGTPTPKTGISLSDIVSLCDLRFNRVDGIQETFSETTGETKWIASNTIQKCPIIVPKDMATEYKNANLCEANLKLVGDPQFKDVLGAVRKIEQSCILLYGKKEKFIAGYVKDLPSDGITAYGGLVCLIPKAEIDVRYVTALLLTPEVRSQIMSICEGEVDAQLFPLIMDKIIVPKHSDLERATFLSEANYNAFESSRKELEQEHKSYIKAVRMRKHALTQSASAIEATFYALNAYRKRQNGTISDNERISRIKQTTVKDAFEYLSMATKDLLVKLDHIADVEYTFAKPEWINPEEFIENYILKQENGWVNFKPVVSWSKGHNLADKDIKDISGETILHKGEPIHTMLFPKDALKQVLDNIVSNATSHGFKDKSRNDYQLRFSWEADGFDLKICVENNGAPIPSDRSTSSLLEYGVSTSLDANGHHGIGCNEIDGIMRKYDGKVELVSSPEDEFKVKYVLTFNRINTLKTL